MATALPTLLYKYASADAGLAMLKSQSLRWSSPNLWPAAYEINGNTGLSFSQKEFLDGTVKLATSLIFNPSAPRGDSALISAINRWREAGRFHKPEEAQAVLRDLLSKMVAQRQGILDEAITSWQTFVQNARVACLSADKDSLTAWDKYADQHRGVVLAIDPQHDEKLSQAKPIRYDSQRVHLTTIKEQISGLLNNTKSSVTERFEVNLLSKPLQLKNEHEWRAVIAHGGGDGGGDGFEDRRLAPGTLKSIYLGPNIAPGAEEEICRVAETLKPRPKVYKTRFLADEYKLEALSG